MKKKFLSLCMVVALSATALIGGTLAYFTDTDAQENVFTTGNVDIDLIENFNADEAKLIPGIDITKEVDVKNTGSEEAYVRVHIAIPSMLDSGSEDEPQYAAYNNTLHWNFTKDAIKDGQWNWNVDKDGANYPGNGGKWNMYQETIGNILYNVYVATYETALAKDEITTNEAIHKVYLDKNVTNKMMTEITTALGQNPKVLVVAEGGQKAGFDNAYVALNTQFGVPGEYKVDWTGAATATPENPQN